MLTTKDNYKNVVIPNFFKEHGFILIDLYENSKKKMSFMDIDGYKYNLSYKSFKATITNQSFPEKFNNCRDKYPLPFDFYLIESNIAIEYDGIFHFEINKLIKDKQIAFKEFIETKKRDEIKNNYCENNNIYLLRINYLEFENIEKILERSLI